MVNGCQSGPKAARVRSGVCSYMLIIICIGNFLYIGLFRDATAHIGGKWYKSRYSNTPRRFFRIPSQVQGKLPIEN